MTNEEAIQYIIRHCNPDYPKGKTEWETAINMAINALKAQLSSCSEIPNSSDYPISRQAAIDALSYCQTYLFDSRDHDKKISLEDAEYALEQLQPAQSKQLQILADVLDGCPLTQPCDKLWEGDLCRNNCKTREPTAECWLRYAEVMASDDETNTPDLQNLHMERGSIL